MVDFKKLLEECNWSDGLRIPVANAENRKLEEEVQRLTLTRSRTHLKYENESTKVDEFKKYLKNLSREQQENQNILLVQHEQLETEKSLCKITKLEKENFNKRVKTLDKECKEVEDRKQEQCKTLKRIMLKLEKLKLTIEWDEHVIENCQSKIAKGEEENEIIRQFALADKKKFRELELKRQRVQNEELSLRQLVQRVSTELNEMDVILTRSIQIYREMHNERTVFVRQWKETVQYLHSRDQQIMDFHKEVLITEDSNELELEKLKELRKVREELINSNKNKQLNVKTLLGKRSALDENIHLTSETRKQRSSDNLIIKLELSSLHKDIGKMKTKMRQFNQAISHDTEVSDKVNVRIRALELGKSHLDKAMEMKQCYIKSLEDIVTAEENLTKSLEMKRNHTQSCEYAYRKELDKQNVTKKENDFESRIYTTSTSKIKKQKKQHKKLIFFNKVLDYKLNIQLNRFQRLIRQMSAKIKSESEENTKAQAILEKKRDQLLSVNHLYKMKVREVNKTFVHIERLFITEKECLTKLKETHRAYLTEINIIEKERIQTQQKIHDLMVQDNIERMKLQQAEKSLQRQDKLVYEAKKYHLDLETATRERLAQIGTKKKIFLKAKMCLEEEQREIKSAISTSRTRINVLKSKYETIMKTFGKNEDGDIITPAEIAFQTMKEKMSLQMEGDKLDNQIKKAEQEIIAMENTLKVVTITNENYKKTLSLADVKDEILNKLKEIEKEYYSCMENLVECRNKQFGAKQGLTIIQFKLCDIDHKISELKVILKDKEIKHHIAQSESQCRQIKIDRVNRLLKKQSCTAQKTENLKKDFRTYKLKEYNRSAFKQLSDIQKKYLETKPNITRYLSEKNLTNLSGAGSEFRLEPMSTSSSSGCSVPETTLTFK